MERSLLSVDEALAEVRRACSRLPSRELPIQRALGRRLAAEVLSDCDSPPHDRATVDGYAVLAADVASRRVRLSVVEEVFAGARPTRPVAAGQATRITTGAPVPEGATAVVMHERTTADPSGPGLGHVWVDDPSVEFGQNISRRGSSFRRGQLVLRENARVRPIEMGILAEVGATSIPVYPPVRAAVLATGDELVPPESRPGPGQIRNSNGSMLFASAALAGCEVRDLGIASDDRAALRDLLIQGLDHDLLVLSGGVSAGARDLVPAELASLNVRQVFHKVNLKPGKPLWFGVRDGDDHRTLVFGLPGNPVSSLVCFMLFVRPAITLLEGSEEPADRWGLAGLSQPFVHRGDRPTYHPAVCDAAANRVAPLPWQGSGDLCTLAAANCLCCFPAGHRAYAVGETLQILWI